jgi:hypothetical protein
MSRLKELPENKVVDTISSLISEANAIKNRQFMGYDVVTVHRNDTGAASDVTVPGSGFEFFEVKFTADTQLRPNGSVRFELYRGNTSTLAAPGSYDIFIQDTTFSAPPDKENSWGINVINQASGNLLIKVYVLATDTGTVVVTI